MPKAVKLLFWLMLLLSTGFSYSADSTIKLVRSLSGPSGKVVGGKFILDEVRNRFVYPQDNSLTVYFECKAPKGDYTLSAYWKDPQGRVVAISPDLKMQTPNDELNSYWILMLDATKPSGIWTVEVRVNGQPVGSHSFDLFVPEPPKAPPAPEVPATPTMDQLYTSISKSLVWLRKLDANGRRTGTYTGVVVAPDSILTALQSIDSAMNIEVEFADGRKVWTNEIFAYNRFQDWALVKASTENVPSVPIGKPESIVIGEQCVAFSVESGNSRTIGAVDIAGRKKIPGFGERVATNPQLPWRAIGSPLLDLYGRIVGVIGGSLAPGSSRSQESSSLLLADAGYRGAVEVTPVDQSVLSSERMAVSLQSLFGSGVLTVPLSQTPVFVNGLTTDNIPADLFIKSKSQFSSRETVIVYTNWQQREKIRSGLASLKIYDDRNRLRSEGKPQTLKLPDQGMIQFVSRFSAAGLGPGLYRADIFWNGLPVWRSFFSITD